LTYVDDQLPGVTRKKLARGWAYYDAKGQRITDRGEIDRLNAVGLPPAYVDAWFCPSPDGHLQATGIDARGRKQYRYHGDFRAQRESAKYDRCACFGRALPLLRARVEADLAAGGLGKDNIVAAIVRLLDVAHLRVGNEGYAKANKSFGATTLRTRHADVGTRRLKLEYRGKSGKTQRLTIEDRSLARIVRRCQDLPGQHLFQYVDDAGEARPVGSGDVNAYIRDAMGDDFTAKHFRTWGASVIAFEALVAAGEAGLGIKALLEPVAQALGNTPAIARKSYVHPVLVEAARSGGSLAGLRLPRATRYLTRHERGLIALLEEVGTAVEAEAA
jgi:DNA topoisomerase-1